MIMFIINSILLGVGLAMDAFSVSLADGLNAPKMSRGMRAAVPLTFGGFQFLMPMIGWFCVRRLAEAFEAFQAAVPWIALILCCSSAERCSSTAFGATKSWRSNSSARSR